MTKPGIQFDEIVSGAYDDQALSPAHAEPVKRVLSAQPDTPKLHKVLAQSGLGRVSAKTAGVRQSTPAPAPARKTRSNNPVTAAKPDFIGADSLSRQRRDQKTQASRKKALPRRAKIS